MRRCGRSRRWILWYPTNAPATRRGACVPLRDGEREQRDRPWWTYEHGSRGFWHAYECSVGKCVSSSCPFHDQRVTSKVYITEHVCQRYVLNCRTEKAESWRRIDERPQLNGRFSFPFLVSLLAHSSLNIYFLSCNNKGGGKVEKATYA